MEPETDEERYDRWVRTVRVCCEAGWIHLVGWRLNGCWEFISPSGTKHDLSAADLTRLREIERDGTFKV